MLFAAEHRGNPLKERGLSFPWHAVATSCFNDHLLLDVVNIESKALGS